MPYFGVSAPPGWLMAAGQWVSRTTYAALFAVIGTTYGAGDGSTYFTMPDLRGRIPVGMDNMGGTSAARMTGVLASTTLGAAGGDQWMQTHTHNITVNDATHAHAVYDPSHAHSIADPGHQHGFAAVGSAAAQFLSAAGSPSVQYRGDWNTYAAATGIGIYGSYTNISIYAAWSGVNSGSASYAGAGGGQNVQPSLIVNYIVFAGA